MINDNINFINKLYGYDVIIVCTSTEHQADYWQDRLMTTRGTISPKDAKIVAVYEDWNGCAGNGLGTLYAYQKAISKAATLYKIDLPALLQSETISVALYHTAGKGTRLAPLPGSENNNKSGVKLPAVINIDGSNLPMTILEAVIKQTGVYASSRRGRVSVFWGDQIFIPSRQIEYSANFHIDILASLAPFPSEEEWIEKGLEKYGIIAVNHNGDAAQLEKVSYNTARRLLKSYGELRSVGTSLGSFSVGYEILEALLDEFSVELKEKKQKLDTDPHFWMPLTLTIEAYTEIMLQKNIALEDSKKHFNRMHNMLKRFQKQASLKPLFGCVDVGNNAYWWDYGQLGLYWKNNMLLTHHTEEAECLRKFFNIECDEQDSLINDALDVDAHSHVLGSKLNRGSVSRSVLSNINCNELHVDQCLMVNVTCKAIKAKNCLIYNVAIEEDSLELEDGTILVGVFLPHGEKLLLKSKFSICGGKSWDKLLEGNKYTFEDIYDRNSLADVRQLEKEAIQQHKKVLSNFLHQLSAIE